MSRMSGEGREEIAARHRDRRSAWLLVRHELQNLTFSGFNGR